MCEVGFITWQQYRKLYTYCGARYDQFVGIYLGMVMEPDVGLKVGGRQSNGRPVKCPVWVNECAYSDRKPKLDRDIRVWVDGTGGDVVWAIATNFTKRSNARLAGYVGFHSNNGTIITSKWIFPAPTNANDDRISYTRDDLFGDALPLEPVKPDKTYLWWMLAFFESMLLLLPRICPLFLSNDASKGNAACRAQTDASLQPVPSSSFLASSRSRTITGISRSS
jgi:hypothetical protein